VRFVFLLNFFKLFFDNNMRVVFCFFCEQKWKSGGGGDIYSEYVIVVVVIIAKGQKIALIMIFLREVHGCFFCFVSWCM